MELLFHETRVGTLIIALGLLLELKVTEGFFIICELQDLRKIVSKW